MINKKNLLKASSLSIILMLVCITIGASCTAIQQSSTTLDIIDMKGGFGAVFVTVKNIGDSTAENITVKITVNGGILNRINITKICSGCGNCSNTIKPDATKIESSIEGGKILGFGPIIIVTSVEGSNAEQVSKTYNGFVIGFLVIITN